jgi:uncharacterized phiE125 gp8 family phage protein
VRDAIQVITPPTAEPVSAADLAAHLKLNTGTAEYAELSGFITSARELFEKHTGRAVLPTKFRQSLAELCGPVELLRADVSGVTAFTYFDADGDEQELEGYELDAAGVPAVVYMPDEDYPATSATKRRVAWVEFVAGWADVAAVPATVKTAIKLMAGHWYRHRENYTELPLKELPSGFATVCDLFDTGLTRGA